MQPADLQTPRLRLVQQTRAELWAMLGAMSPEIKVQLSAAWLALLDAPSAADPWVHGFRLVHKDSGLVVGTCSFKGPPTDGIVEIAYGVDPDQQNNGYATEAAAALVAFASGFAEVRIVRAHTLPESNASKRVLLKCGFRHVGEVIDPDDGLVWRFEKTLGESRPRPEP